MFTTCFINQRGFVLLKGKISYDKLNHISSFTKFKLNDESNFFFYLTSCNYTMKNDPRKLITTPASPPENTSFFKK